MLKVVCNSSPVIHLIKIKRLFILKELFKEVIIPESVYKEILEGKNFESEIAELNKAQWIKVQKPTDSKLIKILQKFIDQGEAESIALALEINANLIVLDDLEARKFARLYNLEVTGTIGILIKAHLKGLIESLEKDLQNLKMSGFYVKEEFISKILEDIKTFKK